MSLNVICKYCNLAKRLCDAHIYPRSWYGEIVDVREISLKKPFARRLPKGLYREDIICLECDNKFGKYETLSGAQTSRFTFRNAERKIMGPIKYCELEVNIDSLYRSIPFFIWKITCPSDNKQLFNIGGHFETLDRCLKNFNLEEAVNKYSLIVCYLKWADIGNIFMAPQRLRYRISGKDFNALSIQINACYIACKIDNRKIPYPWKILVDESVNGRFLELDYLEMPLFNKTAQIANTVKWGKYSAQQGDAPESVTCLVLFKSIWLTGPR